MNKWIITLIVSVVSIFVLSAFGIYGMMEMETDLETVATGSASENLTFQASH